MDNLTIQDSNQIGILSSWNSEFQELTHSGLIVAAENGSWIDAGHIMFIGYK